MLTEPPAWASRGSSPTASRASVAARKRASRRTNGPEGPERDRAGRMCRTLPGIFEERAIHAGLRRLYGGSTATGRGAACWPAPGGARSLGEPEQLLSDGLVTGLATRFLVVGAAGALEAV